MHLSKKLIPWLDLLILVGDRERSLGFPSAAKNLPYRPRRVSHRDLHPINNTNLIYDECSLFQVIL